MPQDTGWRAELFRETSDQSIVEVGMATEYFGANDALKAKMEIVLQTWPLYRVFQYTGAEQVATLPKYLTLFCGKCAKDTFWEASFYTGETNKSGFTSKRYECRNCGNSFCTYYFYWKKEQQISEFFKVGQYPELEERVSQTLEQALKPEDLKMYKNALRLRN